MFKKKKTPTQQLQEKLRPFLKSRIFGRVAQSSIEQLDKCQRLEKDIEEVLSHKFNKGSLTYQKFAAISQNVEDALIKNMSGMIECMSVINDEEYTRLLNYKNDDILDNIQIPRLELYQNSIAKVKEQKNQNESLLYKLDELLLELTAAEVEAASKCKVYEEIDILIKQLDYYEK